MTLLSESHPHESPWSRTSTNDESAPPRVIAPHQSNILVLWVETDSCTYASAMRRPRIPTGRLTKKTDRQPKVSIRGPPIKGPKTAAAAKDADQIPSACARSRPGGKVTVRIAMAVG